MMSWFMMLAAVVLLAYSSSQLTTCEATAELFEKWCQQFNKTYPSEQEKQHRLKVFHDNNEFINKHNSLGNATSFTVGHNAFSDLTLDEFKSTYLQSPDIVANFTRFYRGDRELLEVGVELPGVADVSVTIGNKRNIPDSLDWRTWGGVTAVKNQGSCGSCYAFSAIGALETAYWRGHNSLPDLSEQHILDCTGEYGNGGCGGGWMHTAFKWIQDKQGIASQRNYPYTGRVGTCQHALKPKAANVQSYKMVRRGNEQALLEAVATVGTVSIAYNAATQAHRFYSGGIIDVPNCGNRPTHAVLLIGYGTENGKDYWILKNSWGSVWGEKGFFGMVRGKNMCGIADWASHPIAV